jgi:hypothetical protein
VSTVDHNVTPRDSWHPGHIRPGHGGAGGEGGTVVQVVDDKYTNHPSNGPTIHRGDPNVGPTDGGGGQDPAHTNWGNVNFGAGAQHPANPDGNVLGQAHSASGTTHPHHVVAQPEPVHVDHAPHVYAEPHEAGSALNYHGHDGHDTDHGHDGHVDGGHLHALDAHF